MLKHHHVNRWGIVTLILVLSACGGGTEAVPPVGDVAAAKAALLSESTVVDLLYQPSAPVEWQLGVRDDGTARHGFAQYACDVLKEHGVVTDRTIVRIVDIDKMKQGARPREASLGSVGCSDYRRDPIP